MLDDASETVVGAVGPALCWLARKFLPSMTAVIELSDVEIRRPQLPAPGR